MEIARRMLKLRLEKALPLDDVARDAGLRPSFLSLLEQGEQVPSREVLERLAVVFDVPLSRFFFDDHQCVITPWLTPRLTLEQLECLPSCANKTQGERVKKLIERVRGPDRH